MPLPVNLQFPFTARQARLGLAVLALLAGLLAIGPQRAAHAADVNIALGSEATASSAENAGTSASSAVDGDLSTRWSSAFSDPQWLQLDLGATADISGFTINWEAAFATAYHIEVSNDATTWTQVYSTTSGSGGTESITVPAGTSGRYVRLTGTARTTIGGAQYGYSIYEFQVLGTFTQTAVSTASGSASLQQGTSVDIPVTLNRSSTSAVTVDYATADGSAVSGTDYTSAAGTLTFAPGVTSQSIHLTALPNSTHQPTKTFHVTLANPTPSDVVIGPRSTTTVSILNNNPVPSDGAISTIDDFEGTIPFSSGDPGIFTFSSDAASTPTLTQVAADDRPGASAGNHALRVAYTVGGYGGFVHDLASPQDWSAFDGFSFWVKGTGSGQKVEFEVKDGGADAENGELWQSFFTDDTNGWKKVQVAFANMKRRTDFQPGGAPNDGMLNLTKMWGYAVNLPGGGATNTLEFDDVQVYENLQIFDDFEGANPITDPGTAVANGGVFAWGGNSDSTPTLSIAQLDRPGVTNNHVLRGNWIADSSYGGFSYDIATSAPQDWSSFGGIEFWFYGHNPSSDAVPGSGQQYEFEVKDGGADAEHSALADVLHRRLAGLAPDPDPIQLTEAAHRLPADGWADQRHSSTSNTMRGFALTEPPGSSNGEFDVDQFALYGVNTGASTRTSHGGARVRSQRRRHRDSRDQADDEQRQAARPRRHGQLLPRKRNRDRRHRLHRYERRRDVHRRRSVWQRQDIHIPDTGEQRGVGGQDDPDPTDRHRR